MKEKQLNYDDIKLLEKCKRYFIQDCGYNIADELTIIIEKIKLNIEKTNNV